MLDTVRLFDPFLVAACLEDDFFLEAPLPDARVEDFFAAAFFVTLRFLDDPFLRVLVGIDLRDRAVTALPRLPAFVFPLAAVFLPGTLHASKTA